MYIRIAVGGSHSLLYLLFWVLLQKNVYSWCSDHKASTNHKATFKVLRGWKEPESFSKYKTSTCDESVVIRLTKAVISEQEVEKNSKINWVKKETLLTSLVWKQTASRAANAKWFLLVNWVSPQIILQNKENTVKIRYSYNQDCWCTFSSCLSSLTCLRTKLRIYTWKQTRVTLLQSTFLLFLSSFQFQMAADGSDVCFNSWQTHPLALGSQ